jgi:hypothetical protein
MVEVEWLVVEWLLLERAEQAEVVQLVAVEHVFGVTLRPEVL